MIKFTLSILTLIVCTQTIIAQNIDYRAWINQFYGSNCGSELGNEEHTWKGYIRDNVNTAETYSGCITRDYNGAVYQYGTYASRTQNNVTATQITARIDAWEDDNGSRCTYSTGTFINNDDCRTMSTCNYNMTNPLEYTWTSATSTCGSGDYNMNVYRSYKYATTSIAAAVDNNALSFLSGGTRGFWGARGNWAYSGSDCAASGTITHNQMSSFSTTVSCISQVSFRWRVSSETNFDYLEVWVDGVRHSRISGNTSWALVNLNLGFGTHTIEWRYVKDGSVSSNLDRGFVDQITFTNANSLYAGLISGNQRICSGSVPASYTSTASPQVYSASGYYQWQYSTNNSTWYNIGGANGLSYTPTAGLTTRRYYRRRTQDFCGNIGYSNTITVNVDPLPYGVLAGITTICEGNSTNLTFNASTGSPPYNIVYNGNTLNNINSGHNIAVSPSVTTGYTLTYIRDNNGCIRTTGLNSAQVIVNSNSTTPSIAAVSGKQCPNSNINLSASGGTAGTGSVIEWHSGPNGSGSFLGTGSSISISPQTTTTYYARRTGTCNTTSDDTETVDIRNYSYSPVGLSSSVGYCTDNLGWNHFYNSSDEIIVSVEGDLSGASSTPVAKITNNGSYYQATVGAVGACNSGLNPGEEFFELPRSWNIEFNGTLNPPYAVRYYFPASEQTTLINAANNHIATNPSCMYIYKYSVPNGFYWFKNIGTDYVAPTFDEPTHLVATNNSINGINYAEISGITSFSGGSGAIALSPDPSLPVEYLSFDGVNLGKENHLNWLTASETNNAFYEIEKMHENQIQFSKIGQVEAAGTVTSTQQYQFVDAQPTAGINYYRLKQVDQDGSYSYSSVIAIESNVVIGQATIFPNPTKGIVNYQYESTENDKFQISISNVLGKVLFTSNYTISKGINNIALDMTDYPSGMYHVRIIQQQNNTQTTHKVIKSEP